MNLFEGSRRIGAVILWCTGLVGAVAIWTSDPYLSVEYRVSEPSATPVRTDESECPVEAAREFKTVRLASGRSVSATFCFPEHRGDDGRMFVPTQSQADGRLLGYPRYSSEVSAYTEAVVSGFQLSPTDAARLEDEYSDLLRGNRLTSFGWLAAGLGALYVLGSLLGWIMRGFMGIPSGRDAKP